MFTTEREPFVYPADFTQRVLREFPERTGLRGALEQNSNVAGYFLGAEANTGFSAEQVLSALEGGSDGLDTLREAAERLIRIKALRVECAELWDAWYSQLQPAN